MKARLLAAGLALGLVATGAGARNYVGADHLLHFPRSRVSAEDTASVAAELPGLEPITLETSDRLSLRGWFWKPASGSRGVVVLVHGGGASRMQLLPEARALARHGFGFLAYDSRASGESEGDVVTWGDTERRDLSAAVDFLVARPDVNRARIAVLGLSIGGSTVALEAADDPRPSAVILYATWTSLEDETKANQGKYGWLWWWPAMARLRSAGIRVDAVRPIDAIARIHPRPLLMITGDRDLDTPVPVMQRLFDAAGAPKDMWVVPGAEHGGYYKVAPAEWETRVIAFLERAWGGASAFLGSGRPTSSRSSD